MLSKVKSIQLPSILDEFLPTVIVVTSSPSFYNLETATISNCTRTCRKVTVTAPLVVLTKYPLPEVAVKGEVFAVVHQSTVPVLPNPVCVAPQANLLLCLTYLM